MAHENARIREPTEGTTVPIANGALKRHRDVAWAPPPASLVAGRYRMGDLLGAGGMGAVFRAERVALKEPVAIKFLHPGLAVDKDSIARFLREAQATSRIKNEHVVRILDVGATENGLPFLVMDLLEGKDLGDVAALGGLRISDAVDFVLQASEALAEAHALGIVHRDIKPANLWLGSRADGTPLVKVLDFGISKLAPEFGGNSDLTETSAVFGSPTYMSPEQIRSSKKVDARTDVWSLGVVLYELLTGRQPFEAESSGGILASICADPPIPLLPRRPDAPPALERAILACLEKDVGKRASLASLASLASPAGVLSAERVMRTGQPNSFVPEGSIRPPATSSAQVMEAFARTEAVPSEGLGAAPALKTTSGWWTLALGLGAIVGLALAGVGLWARANSHAAGTPPSATDAPPVPNSSNGLGMGEGVATLASSVNSVSFATTRPSANPIGSTHVGVLPQAGVRSSAGRSPSGTGTAPTTSSVKAVPSTDVAISSPTPSSSVPFQNMAPGRR